MTRQRHDARAAVAIAAGALNVPQGNAHRSFRVARLHPQVQVDHGPATVAGDDEPRVLSGERGGDLGPEPCLAVGGVEAAHGGECLALVRPRLPHPGNVVADFVIACVVAHRTDPNVQSRY